MLVFSGADNFATDLPKILRLLPAHRADPHATLDNGKSALVLAKERNHPAAAEFLAAQSAASA